MDHFGDLKRAGQADGVGDAHPMRTAGRCRKYESVEKTGIGPKGVLGPHGHQTKSLQGQGYQLAKLLLYPTLTFPHGLQKDR